MERGMKRAVIIVKGNVQRVGYRDRVENIARKLGVVGFVENLKPYDIRIIAEGKKENLEKFIQQIKIEEPPILVEKVEARLEEPTHEFEYFGIKRGDWKEELGERFDVAGKLLYRSVTFGEKSVALGEKSVELGETSVNIGKEALGMQREMLGKQDQMLEKRDETVNILKQSNQEMKEFRQDTMQRFDIIDTK